MTEPSIQAQTNLLENLLRETAQHFRLGHEAHGSHCLRLLIDKLLESSTASATPAFNTAIAMALAAQEREDWYGLADTLEYELMDALSE